MMASKIAPTACKGSVKKRFPELGATRHGDDRLAGTIAAV